ncbi:hypothetical protein GCM10023194_28350 [Planotetraspora phitsanulokensis]|uniref:Uncharacterized protein n=1 Tax=Planotetraspora phitsanulokensis TaxID=575192 RepID=A0A8J3U081_9ACTN|nr:hypothetical protein Pph01_10310 [Planotetraspora phitsanulokensis]
MARLARTLRATKLSESQVDLMGRSWIEARRHLGPNPRVGYKIKLKIDINDVNVTIDTSAS